MNHLPEILAPAGNLACLKAAVAAGADAVYFGGQAFNARRSAGGFTAEDVKEAVRLCRMRGVKTNLTLNTLIKQTEGEMQLDCTLYPAGTLETTKERPLDFVDISTGKSGRVSLKTGTF